jgi:hypothetical protein
MEQLEPSIFSRTQELDRHVRHGAMESPHRARRLDWSE